MSIPHLVFGIIFTGIAAVWAIGEATDAHLARMAVAFPAVLIAAGIVGLVATLVNGRSRSRPVASEPIASEPVTADTAVLTIDDTPEPTVVLDDPGTTHEEK